MSSPLSPLFADGSNILPIPSSLDSSYNCFKCWRFNIGNCSSANNGDNGDDIGLDGLGDL